jgi:two-component system cell cycle sensor histidine kinase/response regulator CckA
MKSNHRARTLKIDNASETILIVEDDETLLEVTHRSLEAAGYAIISARNPEEAIRMAERHPGPIHLMVTDVILPGINGAQLASQLSRLRPEMKVLFVSGYTDETIVRHGVLEPGLAFLQKPFSPKALNRKVGEMLAATLPFAEPAGWKI